MPMAINSTKLIQVLCGEEEEELQGTNWIDRWMFFYCFTATLYRWEQWHTLLRLVSRCIKFLTCNPILNPHTVVGRLEPHTRSSNKAVFHVRLYTSSTSQHSCKKALPTEWAPKYPLDYVIILIRWWEDGHMKGKLPATKQSHRFNRW